MDYKKKYNEALERANKYNFDGTKQVVKDLVFYIFPELKESEDERIRKEIIATIHLYYGEPLEDEAKEMIAWLEKQGDKKTTDKVDPFDKYKGFTDFERTLADICIGWIGEEPGWKEYIKDNADILLKIAIEKFNSVQDASFEQKPADEVESKFKVGDWIISDTVSKDYHICKITDIKNGNYTIESTDGYKGCNQFDIFDNAYRLWTIQDAKDGDVLYFNNDISGFHSIGLFKRLASKNEINGGTYRCYARYGGFNEESKLEIAQNNNELHHFGTKAYPATKEQRDTLFAKMKEAGYEWDAEKKELKKSADKQKFKVGDYVVISTTKGDKVVQIASVEYLKGGYPSYITTEGRWFGNGTKARILTDKDMETITIPERSTIVKKIKSWSEEDEKTLNEIFSVAARASLSKSTLFGKSYDYIKWQNWLKSLRDRVQPQPKQEWSEEDETKMRAALAFIKSEFPKNGDEEIMEGTIEWLKSLKQRIGWKPSDAQIEALGVATDICSIPEKQYDELNKLYYNLKKLTK